MKKSNLIGQIKDSLMSDTLESKFAAMECEIVQREFKVLAVVAPEYAVKTDKLLKRTLKHAPIYITTDIDEALRFIKKQKFDLILSSYRFNIGDEDGVDLFNQLKLLKWKGTFKLINNYSEHEILHLHRAGVSTINYPPTLDNCRTAILAAYLGWLMDRITNG